MDSRAAHVNTYVRLQYVTHTIYGGQFIEMGSPYLHPLARPPKPFLGVRAYVKTYKRHNFSASGDTLYIQLGSAELGDTVVSLFHPRARAKSLIFYLISVLSSPATDARERINQTGDISRFLPARRSPDVRPRPS